MVLAPDSSAHFDQSEVHHRLPVSHRTFVQNVMPFLTSLLLHAGLVVFGIATYQAVKVLRAPTKVQIIEPTLGNYDEKPGAILTQRGVEANQAMNLPAVPEPELMAKAKGELAGVLNPGGRNGTDGVGDPVIGVSPHPGGGKGFGPFAGPGDRSGVPFGDPQGAFIGVTTAITPKTNARRIVFVCDASGSMIATFDTLRGELRKATNLMSPRQSYNIIFFGGGSGVPRAMDTTLVPATPEVKRRTAEFLDRTSAANETNPLPALQLAFKQNPDLVFLLTDGDFPDNKAVTDAIAQLNPQRKVKVNTILFVANKAAEEENKAFAGVLKQIAAENGGLFKAATADELP
jgi:hypothetical protein